MTLEECLQKQEEWSSKTFGHGLRTLGIIKHIRKELLEIEKSPHDLFEWIDVIILALDGYWRHGGDPNNIMKDLTLKQMVNFKRNFPFPKSDDDVSEHLKR